MATSARPVALITGASAGIGAGLAREAANDGHDLVLVARRREPMEALAAELKSTGAQITIIPADLSRPGAAAALMKTVEQSGLAIDTLINNAGLGDTGRFDQENPEKILSMLQVNIIALTELTRLVLPQMVARKRGRVMLLASLAAFQPGPGMAVYYATKSYVLSFGRAIGQELRGTGVKITAPKAVLFVLLAVLHHTPNDEFGKSDYQIFEAHNLFLAGFEFALLACRVD